MVRRRPTHKSSAMAGNKHSANTNKGSSAYTPAITNRLKRTTVLQLISALWVARAAYRSIRHFLDMESGDFSQMCHGISSICGDWPIAFAGLVAKQATRSNCLAHMAIQTRIPLSCRP
jgi:hypothetical protein